MEKFVKVFVERPVTSTVLMIILIVLGIQASIKLDISMLPDVEFPTVMVSFPAFGMTNKEIEEKIVVPAERALSTVDGVEKIESRALSGFAMIIINFKWGTNIDAAAIDVSEKLNMASMYMPRNVKPMIFKFSPELMPVSVIAISGKDWEKIYETSEELRTMLDRLPEISYVLDMGLKNKEVQVLADYQKLISRKIGMSMVQTAIMGKDFLMSGGVKFGKEEYRPIYVVKKIRSLEDIKNVKLFPGMGLGDFGKMMGGFDFSSMISSFLAPGGGVKLGDVAKVEFGLSEGHSGARLDGEPSALLVVQKKSGVNTIRACEAVRDTVEDYTPPSGVSVNIVMDQSEYITESLNTLFRNLLIGFGAVVLVLMGFLRDFRVVLMVSTAIPISILFGIMMMYFSGMTINIMSLGGLALAVGMLIDNAIVVTESIYRRNEIGEDPFTASFKGAGEVGGAITASTLTTISVFLPIAFLHGFAEKMFRDLALAITYTLLASLFVSLTFVPSYSRFIIRGAEPRLKRLREAYKRVLSKAIERKWIVITIVLALFALSGYYLYTVGFTLMPSASIYQFRVTYTLPSGTSPEVAKKVAEEIEDYFMKNRDRFKIEHVYSFYGTDERGMMNMMSMNASYESGFVAVRLDRKKEYPPFDELSKTIERELFPKIENEFKGIELGFLNPISFQTEMFGKPLEIEIKGDSDEVLKEISEKVLERLKGLDFLKNLKSVSGKTIKSIKVVPNEDMLKKYGISPIQMAAELAAIHNRKNAGSVIIDGKLYDVVVYPKGTENLKIEDIKLPAMVRKGLLGFSFELVPITEVASIVEVQDPFVITHRDGRKVFLITSDIEGISQSEAMKIVQERLKDLDLPTGYSVKVRGQAETTMKEVKQIVIAGIIGLILMFMIMAGEFESFVQPFMIMFTVPMGIIGIALVYLFVREPLNVISLIGTLTLFGIVVNNGIVMVDRINRFRREGLGVKEAVVEGASTRLRPILMTSLTTITALIPELILKGEGKEFHAPMAMTVIGGLSVATFLTLFFIPALYTAFHGKD